MIDEKTEENDHIEHVYSFWNNQGIIKHRQLSLRLKRFIKLSLKNYTVVEICDAIRNYSIVLSGYQYWYKIKFPLDTFLSSKLDMFMDENKPLETFLRSGVVARVAGGSIPPDPPAISPDLNLEDFKEKFINEKRRRARSKDR